MIQHRPRKRFGQHFLHDQQVITRLIDAIRPQPGQCLVEIGPGLGALTLPLLQRAGELHVIEVDRDLAQKIEESCAGLGRLHVHCIDALQLDFVTICNSRMRVVGNLPYNISTPLIFHLLDQIEHFTDMIFMLQEEVVDRITANPGSKDYGRLSVMVQACCDTAKLFRVAPGAFNPPPKVYSAIVRLVPHSTPHVAAEHRKAFAMIVRSCFNQRRKTLRNGLRDLLEPADIESVKINPSVRPEQLTVDDFVQLAVLYQNKIQSDRSA